MTYMSGMERSLPGERLTNVDTLCQAQVGQFILIWNNLAVNHTSCWWWAFLLLRSKRNYSQVALIAQWHPTPVLLPGKSHGRRSLVGCSPWGHKESDATERLHFTFHFHALEKEMAIHSSVLVWRIPGMGEPGGLPSMGSHRVGHDWSNLAVAANWSPWKMCQRECRITTVLLVDVLPKGQRTGDNSKNPVGK